MTAYPSSLSSSAIDSRSTCSSSATRMVLLFDSATARIVSTTRRTVMPPQRREKVNERRDACEGGDGAEDYRHAVPLTSFFDTNRFDLERRSHPFQRADDEQHLEQPRRPGSPQQQ